MLKDTNVKNSWRCKYQLKQITKTREKKNVATNENWILRKMGLKFQNPNFNILRKITFWNKQSGWIRSWLHGTGCPGKKAACLMRQPWQWRILFARKILIGWNPVSLYSSYPANLVSMLAHSIKCQSRYTSLFLGCIYLVISQKKK